MALSKHWTLDKYFREATLDLKIPTTHEVFVQAAELVNRAVQSVVEQLFPLMETAYLDQAELSPGGSAIIVQDDFTWDAETRTLSRDSLALTFDVLAEGYFILFALSPDPPDFPALPFPFNEFGFGHIASIGADLSSVVVEGGLLPTSDRAAFHVTVIPTVSSFATLSIKHLRIMRAFTSRVTLESTRLDRPCEAVSLEQLLAFKPDDIDSRRRIVYTFTADSLLARAGEAFPNIGIPTITFPRLPEDVEDGTDLIDLPDGAAIEIGLLKLKNLILPRLGLTKVDYSQQIALGIQGLAQSFGQSLSEEEVTQKAQALS